MYEQVEDIRKGIVYENMKYVKLCCPLLYDVMYRLVEA
jgi:hypothetical protein